MNPACANRKAHAAYYRICQQNPHATDGEIEELLRKDATLKETGIPDGLVTEDWLCIDCGMNTAPGVPDGLTTIREIEATAASRMTVDYHSEVYTVRDAIWKKAGMEPFGGCLRIGCLEKRLGRKLKPKDFLRGHFFNAIPGSPRLVDRRKYWHDAPNTARSGTAQTSQREDE